MTITKEQIHAMSPSDRAKLYVNATTLNTDEAAMVVQCIEEAGLSFSEGGSLKENDPLCQAIRVVVESEEGQKACVAAAEKGLPPLAGIDPMLAEKFAVDYGKHNMSTNWAGHFVANVMKARGYEQIGQMGATPASCVARSGELYSRK